MAINIIFHILFALWYHLQAIFRIMHGAGYFTDRIKNKKSLLESQCLIVLYSLTLQHLLFKYNYLCGFVYMAAYKYFYVYLVEGPLKL